MLRAGDVLDLGPLSTTFYVRKTAADTDGRSLEMEWKLGPHTSGGPVHIHPNAIETYEVLEGEFDVYVGDTWKTLREGEKVTVEKGVPHTFRNAGPHVTRVYNTHEPALQMESYFEALNEIANSGVITSDRMTPKAILHLAILMTSYEEEIRSVRPPHAMMRILAFVGRALGYKPMQAKSSE